MRKLLVALFLVLVATPRLCAAQDANLRAELETIHQDWFTAFDKGDGAAMDKLEASNLVLVFPNGEIWKKSGPRGGNAKPTGVKNRALTDVEVRQFGAAAILTGTLTSVNADSKSDAAGTTVVFVRQNGKWVVTSAQWSSGG